MNTSITARDCELSSHQKEYIQMKMTSLEKVSDKIGRIEVVVTKDRRELFSMSAHLSGPIGDFYADNKEKSTVEEVADLLKDELLRQVRKSNEKKIDLARRRGRSVKKKVSIDDSARF